MLRIRHNFAWNARRLAFPCLFCYLTCTIAVEATRNTFHADDGTVHTPPVSARTTSSNIQHEVRSVFVNDVSSNLDLQSDKSDEESDEDTKSAKQPFVSNISLSDLLEVHVHF